MLVVVGGHSRNIGKTSVVAGLIRKLRDRRWTARAALVRGNPAVGECRWCRLRSTRGALMIAASANKLAVWRASA